MFYLKSPGVELQEMGEEARATNIAHQEELLKALKKKDLERFKQLLPLTNPNHFYKAPDFGTCLYIAAAKGLLEFAEESIAAGANVQLYNNFRKNTPLHVACAEGHHEIVQVLLKHGADISALDDHGREPLHCAAYGGNKEYTERHIKCLELLLDSGCTIDNQDRTGATALRIALIKNHINAAQFLLSRGASPYVNSITGKTVQELINEKIPTENVRQPPSGDDNVAYKDKLRTILFQCMWNKKIKEFQQLLHEAISKGTVVGTISDGKDTLLQYACEQEGLEDFISALLNIAAVDPNFTNSGKRKPILLAANNGNWRALKLLVENSKTDIATEDSDRKDTALHRVARMEKSSREDERYLKSIEILIEGAKQNNHEISLPPRLNINAVDKFRNTALHYAAQNLDGGSKEAEKIVLALLKAGSYIGMRNTMGELAIAKVTPSLLLTFLDNCIGTNGDSPCNEGYELTFDYIMLKPPCTTSKTCTDLTEDAEDCSEPIKETEPLQYLCHSKEHQSLFKHPIITSFLYLKWHRIRMLFIGNLIFYMLFVAFLTAHIVGEYGRDHPNADSSEMEWTGICAIASGILLFILALRELFQFLMSPLPYIKSFENLLEVVLIIMTIILLYSDCTRYIKQHLAAMIILLLWIELVFLIGRHPKLSTYITMFTTVSRNFLTFLLWYSLLIVAFALSFYVLFRKGNGTNEDDAKAGGEGDDEKNDFANPGSAMLKTAVMLTGEFDFSELPLDTFKITSHLVFLLFLFLIAVVLLNLLNGLAVSDTQAVKDKAELVGYLSRVALVSHVEAMVLDIKQSLLVRLSQCFYRRKASHTQLPGAKRKVISGCMGNVLIFPELSSIQVSVNRGGKIKPRCCDKMCCGKCSMDPRVIQAAKSIIAKRKNRTEIDEIKLQLQSMNEQLRQLTVALKSNNQKA